MGIFIVLLLNLSFSNTCQPLFGAKLEPVSLEKRLEQRLLETKNNISENSDPIFFAPRPHLSRSKRDLISLHQQTLQRWLQESKVDLDTFLHARLIPLRDPNSNKSYWGLMLSSNSLYVFSKANKNQVSNFTNNEIGFHAFSARRLESDKFIFEKIEGHLYVTSKAAKTKESLENWLSKLPDSIQPLLAKYKQELVEILNRPGESITNFSEVSVHRGRVENSKKEVLILSLKDGTSYFLAPSRTLGEQQIAKWGLMESGPKIGFQLQGKPYRVLTEDGIIFTFVNAKLQNITSKWNPNLNEILDQPNTVKSLVKMHLLNLRHLEAKEKINLFEVFNSNRVEIAHSPFRGESFYYIKGSTKGEHYLFSMNSKAWYKLNNLRPEQIGSELVLSSGLSLRLQESIGYNKSFRVVELDARQLTDFLQPLKTKIEIETQHKLTKEEMVAVRKLYNEMQRVNPETLNTKHPLIVSFLEQSGLSKQNSIVVVEYLANIIFNPSF